MTPNQIYANAIIGMIVQAILDQGEEVTVHQVEESVIKITSSPENNWVIIHPSNHPNTMIHDYSVALGQVLSPVNNFCESIK